ncbi:hypothetical protein DFH08DRAFT_888459 [Mycena albidolilacea]|uniref:Uncharacterized protein n=1 Tax=Mycena albidolilacea TaxID=1033008 RepID=A0AAD6ZHT0_9AGAR|nr:hypothetical protein DFH08DRAFT_888459 [Mycena albidolilacea]
MMQNGMLAIPMPADECQKISVYASDGSQIRVDLESQEISLNSDQPSLPFHINPHSRLCFLKGSDDIEMSMQKVDLIGNFEAGRTETRPLVRRYHSPEHESHTRGGYSGLVIISLNICWFGSSSVAR